MNIYVHVFLLATLANASLVEFDLYTPQSQNVSILIGPNNASNYIARDAKIRFFVYGWRAKVHTIYGRLKTVMFLRNDYNIIEVSFPDIDQNLYIITFAMINPIVRQLTDLIVSLSKQGYPLKNMEIIGHSIGAQIAGKVGLHVYEKTSQKLGKIIGLEPAGPLFKWPFNLAGKHLEKTDAEVVYVIHTVPDFYGYYGNLGTTDVYANNGDNAQPGCSQALLDSCSHDRSIYYYISAVENVGSVWAAECENYDSLIKGKCNDNKKIDLGGNITIADKGTYYLKTNSKEPFVSVIPPK